VPAITVRHGPQGRTGVNVKRQRLSRRLFRTHEQRLQRRIVEAMKHQDLTARQQRGVEFEGWIFGGCTDEGDDPFLHHRQKRILLGFVETVDFIDEQQRALAFLRAVTGGGKYLFQIGDAGKDGGQRFEIQIGLPREQACDGGLAAARRPPQHDRRYTTGFEHASDRTGLTDQMILTDDIVQSGRAQTIRQGLTRRR